jgi:hypothetical protein
VLDKSAHPEPKQLAESRVKDASGGPDTQLLDDLFSTVGESEIGLLASALGAQSPELAIRIKERFAKTMVK